MTTITIQLSIEDARQIAHVLAALPVYCPPRDRQEAGRAHDRWLQLLEDYDLEDRPDPDDDGDLARDERALERMCRSC